MPTHVYVTDGVTDTLWDGRTVDSMPIREVGSGVAQDETGRWVAALQIIVEDNDTPVQNETGKYTQPWPVRVVDGLVTTNSVGKPVSVVPVNIVSGEIGGDPSLDFSDPQNSGYLVLLLEDF